MNRLFTCAVPCELLAVRGTLAPIAGDLAEICVATTWLTPCDRDAAAMKPRVGDLTTV